MDYRRRRHSITYPAIVALLAILSTILLYWQLHTINSNHSDSDTIALFTKSNNAAGTDMIVDKQWGEIYDSVRVFCLVPTQWSKKQSIIEVIATTWGRHCDQLIFVVEDEMAPDTIHNATVLKLSLDYSTGNLWEKVWRMWRHTGTHHLTDAEWFVKIDDDTFFSAINLKGFVRYFNPDKSWYFGHTLMVNWRKKNVVLNAGGCYAVSRGSLRALYPIFETRAFLNDTQRKRLGKGYCLYCVHRSHIAEDASFSVCLRSIGINPSNSVDSQYRERWLVFRITDHQKIERNDSVWLWKWKHPKVGQKENCCSPNLVSSHNYKDERSVNQFYPELDEEYNQPEGTNGKAFEVPNLPSLFLHGQLPFEVDQFRNTMDPPAGLRIYKGPGQERFCHKCDEFYFK